MDSQTALQEARTLACDYVLQDLVLGVGVSGVVREAVCRRSGKQVAVKQYVKKEMLEYHLQTVRKELAIHRRLGGHAHVVKLEAVYESSESIDLVMEQLQGGEVLDRILDHGCLAEEEAATVAIQLFRALDYLHSQKVVHRDVKLDNLLYTREGCSEVKLIDFGLAGELPAGGKLSERCGTPQYAAPEIVLEMPYDEGADVWSAAIAVYAMLTGDSLFSSEELELERQMQKREAPFGMKFRNLSPEAQDFLRGLLNFDPDDRPTAREALEHPWLWKATLEAVPTPMAVADHAETPEARRPPVRSSVAPIVEKWRAQQATEVSKPTEEKEPHTWKDVRMVLTLGLVGLWISASHAR